MTAPREQVAANIERLAAWITSIRRQDIPRPVQERAARVLADDLGAIIGARGEPEVIRFHEQVLARAGMPEATVFRGGRARTGRREAAVANGVAADWLELDEGYRPAPCHAGLYVIPALVAEAEATNLPFGDLLRALVLGYEFVTRIARSWTPVAATMQSHGRYGAIGAAAGVALARGADAQRFIDAVCTAATLTGPSPRTHLADGTLARNVWPAAGAWSGFMAVDWAECGIAGAPSAFYDVYSTVLVGTAHPERLVEGLGERWSMQDGYTKIYACCQHLHSAVEAVIGFRETLLRDAKLEDIESVEVHTHGLALPLMDRVPRTTLGAKFSMPHAVAAALVTGSGGAEAFAAATLEDPAIAVLRDRVSVAPYAPALPAPNDRPARLNFKLRGGRIVEAECLSAQGGPDRPLPPETVYGKLDLLAVPVYPRMRLVCEDLAALPPARLVQGWRSIVDEFVSPGVTA
jgi:2-methylcitrate dehydratase PrpD